jgi:hypothetical protein
MMRNLVLLFVVLLLAPSAVAGITPLDSYMAGGALCVVVRNDDATPTKLAPGPLRRGDTGFVVPVWWASAEPPVLPPGELALVRYGLRRVAPLEEVHTAELGGVPVALSLDTDAAEGAIHIGALITTPAQREATLFIRNLRGNEVSIDTLAIAGQVLEIERAKSDPTINACDTGIAIARNCPPLAGDRPVIVTLGLGEARVYRHAIPFSAPAFRVREGEVENAVNCPTHRHGPWNEMARSLIEKRMPQEVHFCRNRTHEGLAALAQLSPRCIVNLQGSNLARGHADAWAGLRTFTEHAVAQAAPGLVSALIEQNSNFDGDFAQPARAKTDPLTPRDLQYTVFAALAGGCNGIVFRTGDADEEYVSMVSALKEALDAARPWLETVAGVSLGVQTSDISVLASTHYAGPNAALLILLREAPQDEATPLSVRLLAPRWFTPTHQRLLSSSDADKPLIVQDGEIVLSFEAFRDVAAVLLYAELP